MNEPKYHLSGVLRSREEAPEDFDGPLDVILLLLSKNKIADRHNQGCGMQCAAVLSDRFAGG